MTWPPSLRDDALTWKLGAAAVAKPNTADISVAKKKLVLRPKESDTNPHTGAPTHMPANTTLFSPDSSTVVRFHSHLACRQTAVTDGQGATLTRSLKYPCCSMQMM